MCSLFEVPVVALMKISCLNRHPSISRVPELTTGHTKPDSGPEAYSPQICLINRLVKGR